MKNVINTSIVEEMSASYVEYSLAVLIGRAIPDLYDGLKPVTRRVLVGMQRLGLRPDGRFMKAARVEGEVMGKYHPHGGAYGAMVTASQPWTNNHPLVDGHGNWGSPTDGPAAARYTEAKLTQYSETVLLQDVDTWETRPNYDGSLQEPTQLNVKVPHILLNGGEGIGVGYATRIPTHNLRAVLAGDFTPDFPTGCDIVDDEGLAEYRTTGRGSIRMRAKAEHYTEEYGKRAKRAAITFTNLPYHVNTEQVGQQVKDAVEKGKITTVADVRDETDRTGIRIVIIGKANVDAKQLETECYRYTSLDSKFSASNLVIDGTTPVELSPKSIMERWMTWRDKRLVVATTAELSKCRSRLEIVQGMMAALDLIDDIIDDIRRSKDKTEARKKLMARDFSEAQANSILDMRLSQLTRLDQTTLQKEAKALATTIKQLIKLNSSAKLRTGHIVKEMNTIAEEMGTERQSVIITAPQISEIAGAARSKKVDVGPKPRFVSVDEKLGVVTQLKKLGRGATVCSSDDKLIFVCDNGKYYKVPATKKGPLDKEPTVVLSMSKMSAMPTTPIIVVYKLEDDVRANSIPWEALTKCTSRGKRFLPEGAELIHIGGTYTLERIGRRKDIAVSVDSVSPKTVGTKGTKLEKTCNCVCN
jgi:DNA gyrase subunit A